MKVEINVCIHLCMPSNKYRFFLHLNVNFCLSPILLNTDYNYLRYRLIYLSNIFAYYTIVFSMVWQKQLLLWCKFFFTFWCHYIYQLLQVPADFAFFSITVAHVQSVEDHHTKPDNQLSANKTLTSVQTSDDLTDVRIHHFVIHIFVYLLYVCKPEQSGVWIHKINDRQRTIFGHIWETTKIRQRGRKNKRVRERERRRIMDKECRSLLNNLINRWLATWCL